MHFPLKVVITEEISAVERLMGLTTAPIAIAPQARTEKTAEKRILTERLGWE